MVYNNKETILFPLRSNDFDENKRIKFEAVLDYFQTVASRHGTNLEIGDVELKKQGLAWILLNVKVKILDNPTVNDNIYVSTWPSKPRLAEYVRSYDAIKNDKVIFEGLSRWVLVNIQNHKISREKIEYKCETNLEKINLDFDKAYLKVDVLNDNAFNMIGEYIVSKDDIDINHHMNNSKYAKVLFECFEGTFSEIEISYINQAILDDTIYIYSKVLDDINYVYACKDSEKERILIFKSIIK